MVDQHVPAPRREVADDQYGRAETSEAGEMQRSAEQRRAGRIVVGVAAVLAAGVVAVTELNAPPARTVEAGKVPQQPCSLIEPVVVGGLVPAPTKPPQEQYNSGKLLSTASCTLESAAPPATGIAVTYSLRRYGATAPYAPVERAKSDFDAVKKRAEGTVEPSTIASADEAFTVFGPAAGGPRTVHFVSRNIGDVLEVTIVMPGTKNDLLDAVEEVVEAVAAGM